MKQIVVLSGKGGTGKTTVAAALGHLAHRDSSAVLADADVDAANLELLLAPEVKERHEFIAGKVAIIDENLCLSCSICAQTCRFDAVMVENGSYRVDPINCEGCAACYYMCPAGAIQMKDETAGLWFRSETRFGPLFHAHLFAAQENSGKLVTLVKQEARRLAEERQSEYLIVDGPPGIGCPVIAACSGADVALLVTEPSVAGEHDLRRMIATAGHFGVPVLVCVNKYDLNGRRTVEIEDLCAAEGVPVVGRIPFDRDVTTAMVRGRTVTEHCNDRLRGTVEEVWDRVKAALGALVV